MYTDYFNAQYPEVSTMRAYPDEVKWRIESWEKKLFQTSARSIKLMTSEELKQAMDLLMKIRDEKNEVTQWIMQGWRTELEVNAARSSLRDQLVASHMFYIMFLILEEREPVCAK